MMGAYGWMAGFGSLGMLLGMVVWVAVIVLAVWGLAGAFGAAKGDPREDAVEILNRRYAAGEITPAEFETARRALAG